MADPLSAYYSFILTVFVFGFLPMYAISKWYSYYKEKERQKTMREAMRND